MAKVRIRKAAPGETPGYYNKTSQFLKKAQQGAEVQSGGTQEDMLQAYYTYAYEQLSNEISPDRVYTDLIRNGLPDKIAYQVITQLMDKLVDEGVLNPDIKRQQEASQEQSQEQQDVQAAKPEAEQAASNQEQEDQAMFDEYQDMADSEEEYVQDRSYMQDGGDVLGQYDEVANTPTDVFNMDELISNTPGIQPGLSFPSLDEYIPDFQGAEWAPMDALQSSEMQYEQRGGVIKKKQFVKNVMALLKKQAGGEGEEQKDPTLGKGNRMDTLTEDVQKHKNNFLSAVKDKATQIKTEEMYDKLRQSNDPELQQLGMPDQNAFQVGGMTGGQDPLFRFIGGGYEDPDFYEADFLPEAAYGYSTGNLRRAQEGDAGKKYKVVTLMSNPPIYQVVDKEGKEVFRSKNLGDASAYAGNMNGSKPVDLTNIKVNPDTGKPWTEAEWAEKKKVIDDATEGMSRRQKESWIQQQLLLMQQRAMQQGQPTVTADGIPNASINYVPNYVTTPGTFRQNILPWNPLFQSRRFTTQVGSPYDLATHMPYADPLSGMKPIARQVHKAGLFGRPKSWTDIYSTEGPNINNTGTIINDGGKLIFPGEVIPGKTNSPLPGKEKAENESNQRTDTVDRKGRLVEPREESGRSITPKRLMRMEKKGERIREKGEKAYEEMFGHPTSSAMDPLPSGSVELLPSPWGYKKGEPLNFPETVTLEQKKAREEKQRKDANVKVNGKTYTYKDEYGNTMQGIAPDDSYFQNSGTGSTGYDPLTGYYAYGGYLPHADTGLVINNPNNPQPAPANPDLALGNQAGLLGSVTQGPNSLWGIQQSFTTPPPTSSQVQAYNENPANNMIVEPMGDDLNNCTPEQKRDTTSKCYCSPEARKDPNNKRCYEKTTQVGVNFATGKSKTTDPEAMVNVFNAGVRGITGLLNRKDERRRERQMYDNLTSDNLYTAQATKHRGDWGDLGSMAGQYRFDQEGQDRSGFSAYGKLGGFMQDGGSANYNEGDEVYMTEDDIRNFMANGGQIEYI